MLTLTRKDMLLTINDNVIPAMGSSDVPVKFVNDTETYVDFLIEPRVGYYINGSPKSTVCEYDTSNNTFKIPAEAFKNKGILVIAIALIDNADSNHIEVTKELALEVTPAPNGTVILPATDTWQTAVNNLVEQLYNQDYKPQFDEIEENLHNLVKEALNQQNKANNQQTQIDNAIDVMGDYEIVQDNPTQIRFKKGDGTYGDTVNLGDNLASKSMVNAGYDTYSGNSYSGSASDYGIEIGKASGAYEQEGTPTPESPIEPKFFEPKNVNTDNGNFINSNDFELGQLTWAGGIDYTSSEYYRTKKYYPVKYGQTIKRNVISYIFLYGKNKKYLGNTKVGNKTFGEATTKDYIVEEDVKYIRIVIAEINYNENSEIMFSINDIPTEYIDGQYSTTPLDITLRALPNGVTDTLDMINVGKVVFDGSDMSGWIYNATLTNTYQFSIKLNANGTNGANGISNRFEFIDNYKDIEHIKIGSNGHIYLHIKKDRLSGNTVDDLKEWFTSNPTNIYYPLATPTTEQVDLPVIPSYYPFTNAWHDSEVEASDLTWNILARQYGSGQTTVKKDEIVLTELDLNTERTATPTTVKVQLQDSEGKVLYLETSSENIYIQSGRFSGKTVQQVLENSIQAISATDEYIEVDVPDSMTQSIDEEFLVDEVDESETETE